jgi:hypothetical protein
MFGELPENQRPSCDVLDEALRCPKGVPQIHPRNQDAFFLLSLLSMHSVDSSGLIRYSPDFAKDIFALLRLDEEERQLCMLKTLFMVQVVNEETVEAQDKARAPEGKKGRN